MLNDSSLIVNAAQLFPTPCLVNSIARLLLEGPSGLDTNQREDRRPAPP